MYESHWKTDVGRLHRLTGAASMQVEETHEVHRVVTGDREEMPLKVFASTRRSHRRGGSTHLSIHQLHVRTLAAEWSIWTAYGSPPLIGHSHRGQRHCWLAAACVGHQLVDVDLAFGVVQLYRFHGHSGGEQDVATTWEV